MSASVICIKKYHTLRSEMIHNLQNVFYIPPAIYKSALSRYQLLYHSAEYFLSQLRHGGVLRRFDTDFIVVYNYCTLGQIKLLDNLHQLRLSFREAKPEYELPAYVMVSIVGIATTEGESK